MIAAFSRLATSTIGNVLDELGVGGLIVNLRPLVAGRPFCGPAVTAREICGPFGTYTPADFKVGAILDAAAAGDVVVIPAGVGHENLGSTSDFTMVGAYPPGQNPDLQRGEPSERPWELESIAKVPLPTADPIYGKDGPLMKVWA